MNSLNPLSLNSIQGTEHNRNLDYGRNQDNSPQVESSHDINTINSDMLVFNKPQYTDQLSMLSNRINPDTLSRIRENNDSIMSSSKRDGLRDKLKLQKILLAKIEEQKAILYKNISNQSRNVIDGIFLHQISDEDMLKIKAPKFLKITNTQTAIIQILQKNANLKGETANNNYNNYDDEGKKVKNELMKQLEQLKVILGVVLQDAPISSIKQCYGNVDKLMSDSNMINRIFDVAEPPNGGTSLIFRSYDQNINNNLYSKLDIMRQAEEISFENKNADNQFEATFSGKNNLLMDIRNLPNLNKQNKFAKGEFSEMNIQLNEFVDKFDEDADQKQKDKKIAQPVNQAQFGSPEQNYELIMNQQNQPQYDINTINANEQEIELSLKRKKELQLKGKLKLDLNQIKQPRAKSSQRQQSVLFNTIMQDTQSPLTPTYGSCCGSQRNQNTTSIITENATSISNFSEQNEKKPNLVNQKGKKNTMLRRMSQVIVSTVKEKTKVIKKKQRKEIGRCTVIKCNNCGGFKPKPLSPKSRQRLKKKQMIAKLKKKEKSGESWVGQVIKRLNCPPLCEVIMGYCCNLGYQGKDVEQLSYKKLMKSIATNHPVDPYLGDKFDVRDQITVKDHVFKLFDPCGCIKCVNFCKKTQRKCVNKCFKKKKKKLEKPSSMKDMPDSDSDASEEGVFKGLTDASIFIGEGPVLYLQYMKTMAIMFLVLAFLNVPIYIIYSSANETSTIQSLIDANWYKLTLGSLGFKEQMCQYSHVGSTSPLKKFIGLQNPKLNTENSLLGVPSRKMEFKCSINNGYIMQLTNFGFLNKLDLSLQDYSQGKVSCQKINGNFDEVLIHEKKIANENNTELWKVLLNPIMLPNTTDHNIDDQVCNYRKMFKSDMDREAFYLMFKQNCIFKNNCTIDLDNLKVNMTQHSKFKQKKLKEVMTYKFTDMISEQCYKRIFNEELVSNQLIGIVGCMKDEILINTLDVSLHKDQIGLLVVACDALSVLFMYYIFWRLNPIIDEYLSIVDNNVIKYKDFSFQIKDFQLNESMQDQRIIKMKMWVHLNELMAHIKTDSGEKLEIVDIQLSWAKKPKNMLIYNMENSQKTIKELNDGIASGEFSPYQSFAAYKKIDALNEKIERLEEKYEEAINLELKNGQNPRLIPKKLLMNEIEYIFVTLKRNSEIKQVLQMFEQEAGASFFIRKMCCIEDEIKDNIQLEEQSLIIQSTVDPDQINWLNMEMTQFDRRWRLMVQIIIVIFGMMGLVLIIVGLRGAKEELKPSTCSSNIVYTTKNAYIQQKQLMLLETRKRQRENTEKMNGKALELVVRDWVVSKRKLANEMQCYCSQKTMGMLQFWKVIGLSFKEQEDNREQFKFFDVNYCSVWFSLNILSILVTNLNIVVVVILNAVISQIAQQVAVFLRLRYKTEEQQKGFNLIVFMEYFNMGIINLLISFDPTQLINSIRGTKSPEVYNGFDSAWYTSSGQMICTTIFLSGIANTDEILKYLIKELSKFYDRGFKSNLKRNLEDEDDDEINSRKKIQDQVDEVYLGPMWKGPKAISRSISTLMVICSYSSGMPILYIIGFIFYTISYMSNKLVIFKLYRKSLALNRLLPLQVTKLFKTTILLHLMYGCFMLTNYVIYKTKNAPTDELFVMPTIPVDPKSEIQSLIGIEQQDASKNNLTSHLDNALYSDSNGSTEGYYEYLLDYFLSSINIFHQQLYLSFSLLFVTLLLAGQVIRQTLGAFFEMIWIFLKFLGYLIVKLVRNCCKKIHSCCVSCKRKCKKSCACCKSCCKCSKFKKRCCSCCKRKRRKSVSSNILVTQGDGTAVTKSHSSRDQEESKDSSKSKDNEGELSSKQERDEEEEVDVLKTDESENSKHFKKVQLQVQNYIDQIWSTYDLDFDGELSQQEAYQLVTETLQTFDVSLSVSTEDFEVFFKEIDIDNNGTIDKKEVTMFLLQIKLGRVPTQKEKNVIERQFSTVSQESQNQNKGIQFEGGSNSQNETQLNISKVQTDSSLMRIEENDLLMDDSSQQQNDPNTSEQSQTYKLVDQFKVAMKRSVKEQILETVSKEEQERQEKIMIKYKNLFERPCYSENIYMELSISSLRIFYQKAQSELHELFKLFNIKNFEDEIKACTPPLNNKIKGKLDLRIQFEEMCYMFKLTNQEVVNYISFLKKRIREIEKTIDTHFEMIKKVIKVHKTEKLERQMKKDQEEKERSDKQKRETRQMAGSHRVGSQSHSHRSKSNRSVSKSKRASGGGKDDVSRKVEAQLQQQYQQKVLKETLDADPDLKFDNPNIYTYDKKLEQLYEFEDELLKEDRAQKENRRGLQTICRMQGSLTQSYFIYDAQSLKIARGLYYQQTDLDTKYEDLGIHLENMDDFENPQLQGTVQSSDASGILNTLLPLKNNQHSHDHSHNQSHHEASPQPNSPKWGTSSSLGQSLKGEILESEGKQKDHHHHKHFN